MGMTYKKIEKHGIETSLLGFGCMRFPLRDGKIDEVRAEKMLDDAYAAGVDIPGNFKLWNRYGIYRNTGDALWHWANDLKAEAKADQCIKCGKCEEACPQKLKIREDLEAVAELFARLK